MVKVSCNCATPSFQYCVTICTRAGSKIGASCGVKSAPSRPRLVAKNTDASRTSRRSAASRCRCDCCCCCSSSCDCNNCKNRWTRRVIHRLSNVVVADSPVVALVFVAAEALARKMALNCVTTSNIRVRYRSMVSNKASSPMVPPLDCCSIRDDVGRPLPSIAAEGSLAAVGCSTQTSRASKKSICN